MKIAKNLKIQTKQGAASIYIVLFTAILLGVITVGFVRIMLSESRQTTNYDLSQSAYDAALAGIEDGKIALLKYHECISNNESRENMSAECKTLVDAMRIGIQNGSCDTVQTVLGREQREHGEVIVQETKRSTDKGNSVAMQQAYTCVKIQEDLEDYRATLSVNDRTRLIPIRSVDNDNITGIRIRWFSARNKKKGQKEAMPKDMFNPLEDKNKPSAPPVLVAQFFQTPKDFTLTDFNYASPSNLRSNRANLVLHPVSSNGVSHLSKTKVAKTNDKRATNHPFNVQCKKAGSDFDCSLSFATPNEFSGNKLLDPVKDLVFSRNIATSFLKISMPYGVPTTDIAIELCTDRDSRAGDCLENGKKTANSKAKFIGVQSKIDSTGRANDLFRRLEARVELVDTHFPYPEFAIQMTGDRKSDLNKDTYATRNCWYTDSYGKNKNCNNTGKANASRL